MLWYEKRKGCVLTFRFNWESDEEEVTSDGSWFQIVGPATGNERLPTIESRYRGTISNAVVLLKRIAVGDEMKRQRYAQVDPTGIAAPHHVEHGTSVAQSCTWCAPTLEANEGWPEHQRSDPTDGDRRSAWLKSYAPTPADTVGRPEGQPVWRIGT
jgi:hypothetical protein